MHVIRVALAVCLICAVPQATDALEVNRNGTISCDPDKQEVYWQEDVGMDERYRHILVMRYPDFREVLLHMPMEAKSELLYEGTGGTNIPWRALMHKDGDGYGGYRYLTLTTDGDHPKAMYSSKPVTVLMVGLSIYWPVCALKGTVEDWLEQAKGAGKP